jgi:hypothetical protein
MKGGCLQRNVCAGNDKGSFGDAPRIFTFSVRSSCFSVESVLHPTRTSRYEDNLTNPRQLKTITRN